MFETGDSSMFSSTTNFFKRISRIKEDSDGLILRTDFCEAGNNIGPVTEFLHFFGPSDFKPNFYLKIRNL